MAATAAAFLLVFAAACGGSDNGGNTGGGGGQTTSGKLTKIHVGFVPATATLPVVVAIDEGIFKRNGLDVEYTKTLSATNAAIGRQFDIGQSTASDFLASVEGGLDDVVISNMFNEGDKTTLLLASKKSGITDLKDMAGKTLGVPSRSSVIAQATLYLLREAGVDTNTVKVQEMPFPTMADQLKAGRVDVVGAVNPFAGQILASGDAVPLLNPVTSAAKQASGTDSHEGAMFATTTRQYAEQHPEVIEAWRKSIAEAGQFMRENPERTSELLAKFLELPPEVAKKLPLYETNSSPVTRDEIATWIKVLRGGDLLKNPDSLNPDKLVYDPSASGS